MIHLTTATNTFARSSSAPCLHFLCVGAACLRHLGPRPLELATNREAHACTLPCDCSAGQ
eukprot:6208465-Alexandrium_andersonii.AAC.1